MSESIPRQTKIRVPQVSPLRPGSEARIKNTLGAPGPSHLGTWESEAAHSGTKWSAACNACAKYILLAIATCLTLTSCRPKPFPTFPANYREYAYVANSGSNTVSVYDIVNVRVDREIITGPHPVAVASSPTRNEVYVVNAGQPWGLGSLSVIDAEKNAVVATIPLHRAPAALSLSSDGKFAWVANSGSASVSLIDLTARRELAQIPAGPTPVDVRLSPDGHTLAVANRAPGTVTLISPHARQIRATIPGCPGATGLVILPDSSKVFAACSTGHQVLSIALAQFPRPGEANSAQPAPPAPGRHTDHETDHAEALLDVGHGPVSLALKPDGGELFSLNSLSDTISEVVTSTNDVGGAYMIGDTPVSGIVSANNATLYVANRNSQVVTLYAINDGRLSGHVNVGNGPAALAFASNGYLLLVVDSVSGDLAVVRTTSPSPIDNKTTGPSLFTILPAGKDPTAITVKSFKL